MTMLQEDRDTLRNAGEFIMKFTGEGDKTEFSIEECWEYIKETDRTLSHVELYNNAGTWIANVAGEFFMKIDLEDLDKDNYIERSRKVNSIVVTYADETTEHYASLSLAQEGIAETLNGCDLAVNVEYIRGYIGDEHVCSYSADLVVKLTAQPAV